jgi:signal transduction histidine kinase
LITLNLKHENNFLVLEIKDCGIGVLEKERKKIFNNFYRIGSEENRKTKGTGIGLFLVKSICDLHHASIETLPNIPKGSIFKIKFQT